MAATIRADELRSKMTAFEEDSRPLLVCAYEDEEKCAKLGVGESMSFKTFERRLGSIPKDREIVFFCA